MYLDFYLCHTRSMPLVSISGMRATVQQSRASMKSLGGALNGTTYAPSSLLTGELTTVDATYYRYQIQCHVVD